MVDTRYNFLLKKYGRYSILFDTVETPPLWAYDILDDRYSLSYETWLNERYVEEGKGHVAHTDGHHEEIDPLRRRNQIILLKIPHLLPEILMKENDGNQDGVKDKSEEEADEDGYVHISVWVRLHKIFPREAALSVICRKQGITQYSPCFVSHIFCHLHTVVYFLMVTCVDRGPLSHLIFFLSLQYHDLHYFNKFSVSNIKVSQSAEMVIFALGISNLTRDPFWAMVARIIQ